ncbi:AtpZ/AtpI family protein [Halpernia frigidisoli]|uniref:Putative F0F1-ATPase subunit Ca2+/Mg2+ transporter n=1 Tax=Halpernia frigidisoli TaxID=1125876 RepID=A0A1I3F2N7_9FLAO|nr:AtpZ/AtpI family protein [Halpernia frigidisoli]SFI05420.1 Putative F0F1-ATPase subunit Ca2+/Mg2+ transporter [Halpernia frigidisoli]
MKDYGFYSTVVFQMLATIGLAFWGGNWLTKHFEMQTNLMTVGIGFLGLALALYNTLRLLKYKEEKDKK